MNIGFFSETYKPEINGVVTSLETFREELEAAGHKVYVFAPAPELFGDRKSRRERRVFRFTSFRYPFYKGSRVAIPFNWPAQRKLKSLKLDVIHSHTPFSLGLFAGMASRSLHRPHVHTFHTLYPEYAKVYFPGFKKWNARAASKLAAMFCNSTDQVIAPSDGIAVKLKEYGVTVPVTTLPTGIASDAFGVKDGTNLIRRRYGIPLQAPLLLTVARLGKEKSIDYLLEAFTHVLRFHPDAYYLILGDGPDRYDLETKAQELGIRNRVVFTGMVKKRSEVLKAYATSDVFIFASLTDTQCLTLFEAAAAGLPLVARFDKPLEGAVRHNRNGYFIKENEGGIDKFAWKVQKLLTDKKLARQMGRESVKVARANSARQRARDLVQIYQTALAAKQAEPLTRWQRLRADTRRRVV